MNKKLVAAIIVLVLLFALAFPYFYYDRESLTLDAGTRSSLPGQFVDLPDGTVHYELAGPQSGEPVVLIHGFSVPYYIWDQTFDALTQAGFRVLRYDLYGRGYSDRPNVTYGMDLYDRQLANLLQAVGMNHPVNLVGLSMGGFIATRFADLHPAQVKRLCLVDPGPTAAYQYSFTDKLGLAPVVGEYLMALYADEELPAGQVGDFYRPEKVPPGYLDKYRDQMRYKGFKRAILSTRRNRATAIEEVYERVGKQGRPMLLIWGREDQATPFSESEKLQRLMPGIEFHAIEEAGHVPHIEQPEIVQRILIDFLNRIPGTQDRQTAKN